MCSRDFPLGSRSLGFFAKNSVLRRRTASVLEHKHCLCLPVAARSHGFDFEPIGVPNVREKGKRGLPTRSSSEIFRWKGRPRQRAAFISAQQYYGQPCRTTAILSQ
jgi:hypothetical protein